VTLQKAIMSKLYREDIWAGFVPQSEARDDQGWNGRHPSLRRLLGSSGAKLVVDVGVWKGESTINMALAIKNAGIDGCVIAIDTFLGLVEHWKPGWFAEEQLFRRHHGMPDLYRTFLTNVHLAGVSDYVVPMPQTSSAAAYILRTEGILPALVHLDAAHFYEDVLRDAEDYFALLQEGGVMIGDDYVPGWDGVIKAANEFAARHVLPLAIEPPKWIVEKPRPKEAG